MHKKHIVIILHGSSNSRNKNSKNKEKIIITINPINFRCTT